MGRGLRPSKIENVPGTLILKDPLFIWINRNLFHSNSMQEERGKCAVEGEWRRWWRWFWSWRWNRKNRWFWRKKFEVKPTFLWRKSSKWSEVIWDSTFSEGRRTVSCCKFLSFAVKIRKIFILLPSDARIWRNNYHTYDLTRLLPMQMPWEGVGGEKIFWSEVG